MTAVALLLILAASSLSSSCGPKSATVPDPRQNLATAARALGGILEAANGAVDAILVAMPQQSEERKQILGVIRKVVEADDRARAIIRQLNELDLTTQQTVTAIMAPAFREFRTALASGLLGFKNDAAKAKAAEYITAIEESVSILEMLLNIKETTNANP
jgi:hypothetical protein